jgi:hypothetical protein
MGRRGWKNPDIENAIFGVYNLLELKGLAWFLETVEWSPKPL